MAMEQLPANHVIALHHTAAGCTKNTSGEWPNGHITGSCSLAAMLSVVKKNRPDVILKGAHINDGRFLVSCVWPATGNEKQRLAIKEIRKK